MAVFAVCTSDGRLEALCKEKGGVADPAVQGGGTFEPAYLEGKCRIVTRKTLQVYKQSKIQIYTFGGAGGNNKQSWNHRKEGKERLKRSTTPCCCLKSGSSLLKPFLMDVCLICS